MQDYLSMQGKVALVTGASSGLGEHFAQVLARAGAAVAIAARRVDRLEALAEKLRAEGATVLPVALDVTSAESAEAALSQIEATLGTVTVLVNNAGVAASSYCLKIDETNWDFVMDTNLKGAWRMATEVAKRCVAAGEAGSIVNTASILGLRVGFGESQYATAKAGLVQLTKAMALELGRKNVRVNALCPGPLRTKLLMDYLDTDEKKQRRLVHVPMGRFGEAAEMAKAALYLASDESSFVTGTEFVVDGGITAAYVTPE